MGFTGTARPAAPGTEPVFGVEPVLIESRSNGTGGRFRHRTRLPARSSPIASSLKRRAPAKRQSGPVSMCVSSKP